MGIFSILRLFLPDHRNLRPDDGYILLFSFNRDDLGMNMSAPLLFSRDGRELPR